MTQNQMKSLISCFSEKTLTMHQYLYVQDQNPTHLYFIKEGEFQVIRREPKFDESESPVFNATQNFMMRRRSTMDDYNDGST